MSLVSILEVFAAVATALGGYEGLKWLVNFIVHRKEEKRLKGAEANKAESDADQSAVAAEKALRDMYEETLSEMRHEYVERINELRNANTELNKQNLELLKAGARKDEIIEDKTKMIREIQECRVEDAKRIGKLERLVQYFKNWKCFRELGDGDEKCSRRKPAQNPPLKYEPIEE